MPKSKRDSETFVGVSDNGVEGVGFTGPENVFETAESVKV